ncbi:hypothetical protein BANRA_05646 [Klebsiella pneumoniae]|nr:hypothetical protein BANRA_05646 [Klebsiella pneumoniae]
MLNKFSSPFELFAKDAVELNMLSLKSKLLIIIAEMIRGEGWSQRLRISLG